MLTLSHCADMCVTFAHAHSLYVKRIALRHLLPALLLQTSLAHCSCLQRSMMNDRWKLILLTISDVPGSVPVTKREKSMSSYLDTGSVLIESACNVERIAAVLHTLTPFIPGFKYYRCATSFPGVCTRCSKGVHVMHMGSAADPHGQYR